MTNKKILISQQAPINLTPYNALKEKFGVEIEFRQFFKIEPLTSREFRGQRLNFLDYTAVVFSSRHAIDAYFHLSEELRIKIPETMKYFCTTEAVAMYLQKHIVYRKRKIFFGTGTPESVVSLISPKHKGEKFLITTAEGSSASSMTAAFDAAGLEYTVSALIKSVSQDMKDIDINSYGMVVFYNPSDVKSLYENFPEFKQNDIKFISYGKSIVGAMSEAGLQTAINAPMPECPSVAKAIEIVLNQEN
ncbi:MAG: uroporphyrinogen-III synthase [Bacteroidales bacterium]|nr:uroporphyrinogen-III synthase [Bacteroidales bacterium]